MKVRQFFYLRTFSRENAVDLALMSISTRLFFRALTCVFRQFALAYGEQ